MELQVWVEDSLRVVCGVSMSTRCQEVVIALAQDLGQTGRYVLTLKLRGSERQLLKDECPLQELSNLGRDSADALLVLRRTGPSTSSLPAHKNSPRIKHRPRTRTPDPLPSRPPRETEPSSLYGTYPRKGRTKKNKIPVPSLQKDAVYLQLLQQARTLQELEECLEEQERQTRDSEVNQDFGLDLDRDLTEQLAALEERQRQNEEELGQEEYWMGQLEEENRRAKDLSVRLEELQWSVHHQTQRLSSLLSRSDSLQSDTHRQTEEALRPLEDELQQRHLQGERITAALEETEREMQNADRKIRVQKQLMEDLSKEIRQCNLQQFIVQSGTGPAPSDIFVQSGTGHAPSDLFVQPGPGSGPYDITNLRSSSEIYLSNAGILE
ncbi:hypothetical protein NL108_018125 [Boleophthalmus pectinirostris]|uniref:ras association domain-containing protein 7-like n=1 Tax=Boleophthalmus pectinirostris TaxID=150288 RepID=UPI0024321B47|nr:ras association domain-containing protein 7-like [Boleophthalmus pectinirostris]KAJ0056815.1 hypothetical protein NL108_018125 [Boleophthalmus pectinirostris]